MKTQSLLQIVPYEGWKWGQLEYCLDFIGARRRDYFLIVEVNGLEREVDPLGQFPYVLLGLEDGEGLEVGRGCRRGLDLCFCGSLAHKD